MTLLTKILLGIIITISAVAGYFYIQNTNIKDDLKKEQNKVIVSNQNVIALQDRLSQKTDSLKNLAVEVKKLNGDLTDIDKNYVLLRSKYVIALDSIKTLHKKSDSEVSDSTIIVKFYGNKHKIHYDGRTIFQKKDSSSTHDINIWQDPLKYTSELYVDDNRIIRNRVYADGLMILNEESILDSSVFLKLFGQQAIEKPQLSFWDKLKLQTDLKYVNKGEFLSDRIYVQLGAMYQFENGFTAYAKTNINRPGYSVGLNYSKSIKEIIGMFR
jgi:hypothetical protein